MRVIWVLFYQYKARHWPEASACRWLVDMNHTALIHLAKFPLSHCLYRILTFQLSLQSTLEIYCTPVPLLALPVPLKINGVFTVFLFSKFSLFFLKSKNVLLETTKLEHYNIIFTYSQGVGGFGELLELLIGRQLISKSASERGYLGVGQNASIDELLMNYWWIIDELLMNSVSIAQ